MARTTLALLCSCLLLTPLAACKAKEGAAAEPGHGEWDYSNEHGPQRWAELDKNYDKCATGEMQSPIDLPTRLIEGGEHLEINYSSDALRIVDNGHTIQVNHQGESRLSIEGVPFRLVQYHFHSPSEHAEQGQRHSLELHLVHTDDAGNYAVVGVFLETAELEDGAHESLWKHLPMGEDMSERVFVGEPVDPLSFLPAGREHYRYHGSLTTPPCTETVTWLVMRESLKVTAEHIEAFRELYQANARPLQMRPDWCLDVVPMSSPVSAPHSP